MKKISILSLMIFLVIIVSNSSAQLYKTSWDIGGGVSYPRFMAISSPSHTHIDNYGAWGAIERRMSEHVGLRILSGFYHIESRYPKLQIQELDLISISGDLLYYIVPCEVISPYIGIGLGGIFFKSTNSPEKKLDENDVEYQMNMIFGAEWNVSETWKIQTEFDYHTASTNRIDGRDDPGFSKGILGGNADTYMTFDLGVKYYFGFGEKSKLCDLYDGLKIESKESLTIADIEKIIKENLPKEIIKEVIVEKPAEKKISSWTLVGVNFEFDSARLDKSSYPILASSVIALIENPYLKVKIVGYSDNIGSDEYNKKLSLKRAQSVKNYLISKGIDSARLEVEGLGNVNSVGNNETESGRALNRRIEFQIIK